MTIAALTPLLEARRGPVLPLPARLTRLYGEFRMPAPRSGFHVFSNFVASLDGIVSLAVKGHSSGGDISGFNAQDRMVMGLLRAVADVVVVGSGTLDADPRHIWTPQAICPALAAEYRRLQASLKKRAPALNVVVTARGAVNLKLPVFSSGEVPAMIFTTRRGAKQLLRQKVPDSVQIRSLRGGGREISAAAILQELSQLNAGPRVLIEGGPALLGVFYQEHLMHEQFLSLAPQIAGRRMNDARLSLVMGATFAPGDPRWSTLVDARRGSRLLFLRYAFRTGAAA